MTDSTTNNRYERVVLLSVWDGLIGPSGHTDEAVAMKCRNCKALVQPGDEDSHDNWHQKIADGMRARRR